MGFMQAQAVLDTWVQIDGNSGLTSTPADIIGELPEFIRPDGADWDEDAIADHLADVYPVTSRARAAIIWRRIVAQVGECYEGGADSVDTVSVVDGWGIRSSAPGFMDATDWCVYTDAAEALDAYYAERLELDEADPEALAHEWSTKRLKDSPDLLRAWKWHRENSTHDVSEAARLARAERWFSDLLNSDRAEAEAEYDSEASHEEKAARWSILLTVNDDEGERASSQSMGAIDMGEHDEGWTPSIGEGYARTVAAELAAELMGEYKPTKVGDVSKHI